jgi:hemerythrin-like domain-containing protein
MQTMQQLAEQICGALQAHAQLEEELFYPAVREALAKKKEEDLVDEAEVEHQSLKQLIAALKGMQPEDPKFKATMTVLGEYVKHHVKEEESEMFDMLERSRAVDWQALAPQMMQRHDELLQEMGLLEADDSADSELDMQQAMQGSREDQGTESSRSSR